MSTLTEKIAVMQAFDSGISIEFRNKRFIGYDRWEYVKNPVWNWEQCEYRIVFKKPSIDWSHVSPDYKYLAIDSDGDAFLYQEKPREGLSAWINDSVCYISTDSFSSYAPGNCNWRDSLIERSESSETKPSYKESESDLLNALDAVITMIQRHGEIYGSEKAEYIIRYVEYKNEPILKAIDLLNTYAGVK